MQMSNLIYNERVKYAATFFNNLGVAAFATGAILPLFLTDLSTKGLAWITLAVGVLLGTFLLFCAYHLLGGLNE
jgi:hypothetical protein